MYIKIEIHEQIKVETRCVSAEAGSSRPLVTIHRRNTNTNENKHGNPNSNENTNTC